MGVLQALPMLQVGECHKMATCTNLTHVALQDRGLQGFVWKVQVLPERAPPTPT
eukprot:CAMPEP_0202386730 /NCGR_PEP_ID=MMETSP1127-20130417/68161_1 /ASSEMBLY_ACC=CAM_ASM_000462 /TAXON_ID=3047 /ORGANISM="Dunaliella tertiolecta, Strain CCMP1320" /LENGTH=53 /DNA_ID=CAMNT_0048987423 /DNA_START=1026 /DNA_END=1183 /DNA_ORIENTATION=+